MSPSVGPKNKFCSTLQVSSHFFKSLITDHFQLFLTNIQYHSHRFKINTLVPLPEIFLTIASNFDNQSPPKRNADLQNCLFLF